MTPSGANRRNPSWLRGPWAPRLVVLTLMLVGIGMRLPGIGTIPPGLYHDEAQHGLDALDVLTGHPQFYFAGNNGREPLFIYLVTAGVAVLGRTPLAVRLPAAFVGILTLAATYDLGRVLWRRRVGTWALAVLAVTFWHVHLSRVGFRAVLLPLFTALALAQAARALRASGSWHRAWRYWVAAGVLYGASWYTYMAARFTPVAIAAMLAYGLAFQRRRLVAAWRGIALGAMAALLVLLPLGIFTLVHPDLVLARSGQVSIFSPSINGGAFWATLVRNTLRTLGMFTGQGDRIWRHNLAYRPVWGPALGLAFLVGLGVALARARRDPALALSLLWTGVMALPTLLAEDTPHFLRAVGVLPTAVLLPAVGLEWIGEHLRRLPRRTSAGLARTVPALLVVIATLGTGYDYFVRYQAAPLTYHWFEAGPVAIAGEINRLRGEGWDGTRVLRSTGGPARAIYVDPQIWETWTALPFLVPRSAVTLLPVDGPVALDSGAAFFVWPYRDWEADVLPLIPRPAYLQIRVGPEAQGDLDPEPASVVTIIQADALPDLPAPVAQFANGIRLRAALVAAGTAGTEVRLWWDLARDDAGDGTDYTVFVHYYRDGERIAQHDGQPGLGHLPTSTWVPGDVIMDSHHLPDITVEPGHDTLHIGLYRADDGTGLPAVDANGAPTGDWVALPAIPVATP